MVRPNGSVMALDSAAIGLAGARELAVARGLAEDPFIRNALSLAATGAPLLQRCCRSNLSIGSGKDNRALRGSQRLPAFGSGNGVPAAGAASAGGAAGAAAAGFGFFGFGRCGFFTGLGGTAGWSSANTGFGSVVTEAGVVKTP